VARKKQERMVSNIDRENLIEAQKPIYNTIKGNWNKEMFENENQIVIEMGCGRGEYTVGMAKMFPEKNFIGIDLKGDRIAVGSDQATDLGLKNVAFLRANALFLPDLFAENEVSELWITFPDPRARLRDARRRLTYTRFLEIYKTILKPGSYLFLKTDNDLFFDFSRSSLEEFGVNELQATHDLYSSELIAESLNIKTRFEEIFTSKGFKIKFLRCRIGE
jgi:tRNA (guanine-N7-)-methyltransferase